MKMLVTVAFLAAVVATPSLAASKYSLVKDTVGNCSAAVSSPRGYPGMKVMSMKKYPSMEAANKALDGLKGCAGLVR
ncbi:hypothetical protein [uncultured Methylovirgula sp.]|uniref:hypothetical protein n=1 Tax=uncultured Methylovirgula sp. TaxID=1285960 RepID=UPI002602C9A8|nr:hypothetical protein [uncultured Methylovirgula sp.]